MLFARQERYHDDALCSPFALLFSDPFAAAAMPDSTIDLRRVLAETFIARAEHHPTLGSTNDRARECVGDGGPTPLLVVADQQTRGRGRGTNRWWTGPGCLAFSLLLSPETTPSDPRRRPLVALAAGVAVVDAIRPLVDRQPVGLHWPNDVFVGDRKLAGVLVEVPAEGSHIVGIGVNTNNSLADAPVEIRDRAVTLYDLTGRRHDQTGILVEILKHFAAGAGSGPDVPGRAGRTRERVVSADWPDAGDSRRRGIGDRPLRGDRSPTARCCWTRPRAAASSTAATLGAEQFAHTAPGPREPSLIMIVSSAGRTKIAPSPMVPSVPVRATLQMVWTVRSRKSSLTTISSTTLRSKSRRCCNPRYISMRPP